MKNYIKQYQKELLHVAGFAESTVETYTSSILAFCEYIHTTFAIDPVDSQGMHLQSWLKTRRPGISRSRLRQHQFALKSFFAFLKKRKVIDRNPAKPLTRLRKKKSEKNKPISADIAFKLLNVVDCSNWFGRRNHLIIAMLWCLGLRISELTGLTVASFEPDHEPQSRVGLLRIKGKNKKQRALFVVDKLYDDLCNYLNDPESPKAKKQPLFPVNPNKSISANRVQKLFKEYVQKADIKVPVTPHILRHSFATEMYCQGVPYSAVQAMLGHEKKAETAVYVHIPDHMKKQALTQVSIFGGDVWQ